MNRPLHLSRRDSLVLGTLAGFGLASHGRSRAAWGAEHFGAAERCVLIWLDGGPSHLETFDPKPEAAAEIRGPLGIVRTRQPGIVFSEGLPQLAERSEQLTVIRSMTSPVGEHNLATLYALTGHIPGGRAAAPAFTLPAAALLGQHPSRRGNPLPVHVAIPHANMGGGAELTGFLGPSSLPWSVGRDAGATDFMSDLLPGQLDAQRLARRGSLLAASASPALHAAIDLLCAPKVQKCFDISREPKQTLSRYGNKPIGQNCLLARRLLESGVPMVTINQHGWDTHDRLHERLHAGYTGAKIPVGLVPSLDQAVAALLDDLQSSGLLQHTLVVVMGEFGRTPKINTLGGRDHWSRAYSVMLAGAGLKAGLVYGTSDRNGEMADAHPVTPADLVATLYHLLGIDPTQRVPTADGQQFSRVPEGAGIIHSILA